MKCGFLFRQAATSEAMAFCCPLVSLVAGLGHPDGGVFHAVVELLLSTCWDFAWRTELYRSLVMYKG